MKAIARLSNSSGRPVDYRLLLANSFPLSVDELQINQSEEELRVTNTPPGPSRSALRLAAFSSESNVLLLASQTFLIRKR